MSVSECSRPTWVTHHRRSHFSPAFWFLSADRRKALALLYAVFRLLDDAVDEARPGVNAYLSAWREVFETKKAQAVFAYGEQSLAQEFLSMAERLSLPLSVMLEFLEKGVLVDLQQNRFETPLDTESYCYGVASTVGLACLAVFGVPQDVARNYAVRLGVAVQWVNLVRDVAVDARMNRIYLPLEHLDQFGYTPERWLAIKDFRDPSFQQLMSFEAKVARSHFARADELMPASYKKELLPARVMGQIYHDLLQKIEHREFAVLETKVRLNLLEKTRATWKAWKK